MEVEEADAEARRLDAGAGDGVRDVVKLEIEEHVDAVAMDHAHDLGAGVEEELLPHLEDTDVLCEERDQPLGFRERLDVEREDEPVTNAVAARRQKWPPCAHRGPTSAAARAAASPTGTSTASLSVRRFSSTIPRARPR